MTLKQLEYFLAIAENGLDPIERPLRKTPHRLVLHRRATDRPDIARRHAMP